VPGEPRDIVVTDLASAERWLQDRAVFSRCGSNFREAALLVLDALRRARVRVRGLEKAFGYCHGQLPGSIPERDVRPVTGAERDVLMERAKQRRRFDDAHDDEHAKGALVAAAVDVMCPLQALSAEFGLSWVNDLLDRHPGRRDRLVIAAALVIAEIDRIDRAAADDMAMAESTRARNASYDVRSRCTCTGLARDAHDRGCPVRKAHPRVDLGDPPLADEGVGPMNFPAKYGQIMSDVDDEGVPILTLKSIPLTRGSRISLLEGLADSADADWYPGTIVAFDHSSPGRLAALFLLDDGGGQVVRIVPGTVARWTP